MTTFTCQHVAVLTVDGRTRFLPAADEENAQSLARRMMLAAVAQTNWSEQSYQEIFRPKALEYAAESLLDSQVAEIAQLVEDAGALEAEQIQFGAATRHPDPMADPSPVLAWMIDSGLLPEWSHQISAVDALLPLYLKNQVFEAVMDDGRQVWGSLSKSTSSEHTWFTLTGPEFSIVVATTAAGKDFDARGWNRHLAELTHLGEQ